MNDEIDISQQMIVEYHPLRLCKNRAQNQKQDKRASDKHEEPFPWISIIIHYPKFKQEKDKQHQGVEHESYRTSSTKYFKKVGPPTYISRLGIKITNHHEQDKNHTYDQ